MIAFYVVFLLISVVAYILARKLNKVYRLLLALAIFVILSISFTVAVIAIGDKPSDDAIIYRK